MVVGMDFLAVQWVKPILLKHTTLMEGFQHFLPNIRHIDPRVAAWLCGWTYN
jgi:hypothetical protein